MGRALKAVLFDVDGTLVDSNDAHADAWVTAFREHGVSVEWIKVRRSIGMGGDKLMPAVSGIDEASAAGAAIAEARGKIFKRDFLPRIKPFRNASRLVAAVKDRGYIAVGGRSAPQQQQNPRV